MLRDLAVVLACTLTGAVVATACSSPEECNSCCDGCGTSGVQCASTHNCGDTGFPPDAGVACTKTPGSPRVCSPGATQSCRSVPASPPTPTCVAGSQTCNAAGTGFSLCDDVLPLPDACATPGAWSCDADLPACGDATSATSIAVAATGEVVIAASHDGGSIQLGATTLPAGLPGFFVAKFDATGAALWAMSLENVVSARLAVDEVGDIYITGTFSGTLTLDNQTFTATVGTGYLVKLGPTGAVVWAQQLRADIVPTNVPAPFEPTAIAVVQGSPVIAGNYSGQVNLAGSTLAASVGQDGFVASYDRETGDNLWSLQIGTSADDTLSAIAGDEVGNIVVGGHTDGTASCPTPHLFFAQISPTKTVTNVVSDKPPIGINALALQGGVIFATGTAARPVAVNKVFVDAPGFVLATTGVGISWYVPVAFAGEGIAVDDAGHVTAVGATPDARAGIAKFDRVGDRFYVHAFAAYPTPDQPSAAIAMRAVALAPDHGAVVAGSILGRAELALGLGGAPVTSDLGPDAFVAHFAP
jgi:outer membrane protein assembly factor BamB